MRELNRTRRLIIASSIFVIIIIIGLVTFRRPDFEYKLTTDVMVDELISHADEMTPGQAREIIESGDALYRFVDLRSPYDFDRGSIQNAVNIPVSDILDETTIEYIKQLEKDSITLVFFCNDQRVANGSWMMLKQLGFDHVRVLLGGLNYLENHGIDEVQSLTRKGYDAEEPAMDFAAFMQETGGIVPEAAPQDQLSIQPIKRKKKSTTEGGC